MPVVMFMAYSESVHMYVPPRFGAAVLARLRAQYMAVISPVLFVWASFGPSAAGVVNLEIGRRRIPACGGPRWHPLGVDQGGRCGHIIHMTTPGPWAALRR